MKKILTLLISTSLLICSTININAASIWSKYVSTDKSYSFHYPTGWKVTEDASFIVIENSKTEEQLIMAMIPFNQYKSPMDLANDFLVLLGNPNTQASNWQVPVEAADNQVIFNLADKSNGKEYSGLGIVNKLDQQAMWFSYFSPASDFYHIRAYNILEGFIGSIGTGSTSKTPTIDYNINVASKIESNAKAFTFVLEFALGAPFTQSQEKAILDELKDGWRYQTEEELEEYSKYPTYVKSIMKMKQKDLEELRADLETLIREWLKETDKSDPAVKIINSNLKKRGKIMIKGEPPLTDMSLTAYSEIIAYSRLLQKDSKAKPEDVSAKTVNTIKKQVKKVWNSFSTTDKEDIATTPGLWVCLRTQLKYGSKEEQKIIRANLKKLEAVTRDIETNDKTNTETSTGTKKPMSMAAHNCLMQMRQQSFNTYMWSHGFNYLPATGQMW